MIEIPHVPVMDRTPDKATEQFVRNWQHAVAREFLSKRHIPLPGEKLATSPNSEVDSLF